MKKLLTLAAALALTAGIAATAHATSRWTFDPVLWRSGGTVANRPCGVIVEGQGYCDSSFRFHGEDITGAYKADTTAPIYTHNWAPPPPFNSAAGGTNDSTTYAVLYVSQAFVSGAAVANTDSFYVVQQASYNGVDWVALTATNNQGALFLATHSSPTGGVQSNAILRLPYGTDDGFIHSLYTQYVHAASDWPQAVTGALLLSPGVSIAHWPIIRFIVIHASAGSFQAQIGHWTERGEIPVRTVERLNWRSRGTAANYPCATVETGIGYCDSATVKVNATNADTTAPVSTADWIPGPHYAATADGVTDTLNIANFVFRAAPVTSTITNSADTDVDNLQAEVSLNGVTWKAATNVTVTMLKPTNANASYYPVKWTTATAPGLRMPLSGTGPAMSNLFGWPLIRFIHTASSAQSGEFEAVLYRYKPQKF